MVWAAIVMYRIFMALFLVQTSDVPDEWYQSTEPAYTYLTGKGEYTWEWKAGIRSFAYPLPFAIVFRVMRALLLDDAWAFWAAPKVMAGIVAYFIDRNTYALARSIYGKGVARKALCLSLLNWWVGYLGCRTQSNVAEGLVLLLALQEDQNLIKFLFLAGLGCTLRITFVLPIYGPAITHLKQWRKRGLLGKALGIAVFMVCFWLSLIAIIDYSFYGEWMCTPLRFLEFNYFQGLSELFGVHTWHWYLTQALPVEISPGHMILTPFLVHMLLRPASGGEAETEVRTRTKQLLSVIAVTVVGYSTLAHKELRFVFPLIPLFNVLLAWPMHAHPWLQTLKGLRRFVWLWIVAGMLIMFPIFAIAFQRGTLDAMAALRQQPEVIQSLDILMNCHSAPSYSQLHRKVEEIHHVNCDVSLDPSTGKRSPTETTLFQKNATAFVEWVYLQRRPQSAELAHLLDQVVASPGYHGHRQLPEYFMMFNRTAHELLHVLLIPNRYERVFQTYHTFWLVDDLDTDVDLWRRTL